MNSHCFRRAEKLGEFFGPARHAMASILYWRRFILVLVEKGRKARKQRRKEKKEQKKERKEKKKRDGCNPLLVIYFTILMAKH